MFGYFMLTYVDYVFAIAVDLYQPMRKNEGIKLFDSVSLKSFRGTREMSFWFLCSIHLTKNLATST